MNLQNIRNLLSFELDKVELNLNLLGNYLYHNVLSINFDSKKRDINSNKKKVDKSTIKLKLGKYINDSLKTNTILEKTKTIMVKPNEKDNNDINNNKESPKENAPTDDFLHDFEIIGDDGEAINMKQPSIFKKRKTKEDKEEIKENNKIKIDFDNLEIKDKTNSDSSNEIGMNTFNKMFKPLVMGKINSDTKSKSKIEFNDKRKEALKIKVFFEYNNVTKKAINEMLNEFKNNIDNFIQDNINLAMKEYLENLLLILNEEKNNPFVIIDDYYQKPGKKNIINKEIFSSSIFLKSLEEEIKKRKKGQDYLDYIKQLKKKIIQNYYEIKGVINNIIKSISKNISKFPYTIKCIFKIIDVLFHKKYPKDNYSYLKEYLFKAHFLIGTIILPIIKNPNFNGIISSIISDITSKNLKIVHDIFEKMISGNLFNTKDEDNQSMVLYNMFIIETLPQIFEIIENFGKIELPDYLKCLVNSVNNKLLTGRNINYDYFKQKPDDKIQFNCVCFSFENLFIFYSLIMNHKTTLIDQNTNSGQKKILNDTIIALKNFNFKEKYMEEKKEGKIKYFYFTNLSYVDKIEKIMEDISLKTLSKDKIGISSCKTCLTEVLSYENYNYLTDFTKMEDTIKKPKANNRIKSKGKKGLKSSLIQTLESIEEDDADFEKIIFPKIENILIFELNSEQNNRNISICTNYLKLKLGNLPEEYIKNNYSLLFNELIKETKEKIKLINSNIIFEYYTKLNGVEKICTLSSHYNKQIRFLEKLAYTEYLYARLQLPWEFNIQKDSYNIITKMEFSPKKEKKSIAYMIEHFPDFRSYEKEYDNILDIEEKAEVPKALKDYFSSMKNLINKEFLFEKLEEKERNEIAYDLKNYILNK